MKENGNVFRRSNVMGSGLAVTLLAGMASLSLGVTPALGYYHGESAGALQAVAQTAAAADVVVVDMNDRLRFVPAEIRIKVGDTVEWRGVGMIRHTVTNDPTLVLIPDNAAFPKGAVAFDSGWVTDAEPFRYTFTAPGTYRYVCLPHERAGMMGVVVVD